MLFEFLLVTLLVASPSVVNSAEYPTCWIKKGKMIVFKKKSSDILYLPIGFSKKITWLASTASDRKSFRYVSVKNRIFDPLHKKELVHIRHLGAKEGIFFCTQYPSLGLFLIKKLYIEKTKTI